MIQLLLALLQKKTERRRRSPQAEYLKKQTSNLATSHNKSFRHGRGFLVPGRRLSRSTVSTAAPSEACSGSSVRTPGTSPSARTQKKAQLDQPGASHTCRAGSRDPRCSLAVVSSPAAGSRSPPSLASPGNAAGPGGRP